MCALCIYSNRFFIYQNYNEIKSKPGRCERVCAGLVDFEEARCPGMRKYYTRMQKVLILGNASGIQSCYNYNISRNYYTKFSVVQHFVPGETYF